MRKTQKRYFILLYEESNKDKKKENIITNKTKTENTRAHKNKLPITKSKVN